MKNTEHKHGGESMEEVIHYLDLKNKYYEKFLAMTEQFLLQVQQDRWENMEYFMDNRERILNIIRSYDFKIAETFQKIDVTADRLQAYGGRVREIMDKRESLGRRIMDQDLTLIGKIDEVRTDTIRELKKTQETGQKIHSFASPQAGGRRNKAGKDV